MGLLYLRGGAGSGESEIRKWIISNDWLDAIIALPSDIFYNTGIFTYIWIVTNKKADHRKGKVQLINATDAFVPMKKSLNNKRKLISDSHIDEITRLYTAFEEGPNVKIFDNEFFGYFQVTVEQPERKNGRIVTDKQGKPKPNSKKRDTENIPLSDDLEAYFQREIAPHVPDTWIDYAKTRIGYKINFTKYFYQYTKPVESAVIKQQIVDLEKSIVGLLDEILND